MGAGAAVAADMGYTPTTLGNSAYSNHVDAAAGKNRRVRFVSRSGVLAGALASAAIFGFPVFCQICPVGLTFATVLLIMSLFAFE